MYIYIVQLCNSITVRWRYLRKCAGIYCIMCGCCHFVTVLFSGCRLCQESITNKLLFNDVFITFLRTRKYSRQVFYGGQFLLTNRPIRWPFGELSNSTVGSVKVYTWLLSYENSRFSPIVMFVQICLFDRRFINILLLISSVLMNFNRK